MAIPISEPCLYDIVCSSETEWHHLLDTAAKALVTQRIGSVVGNSFTLDDKLGIAAVDTNEVLIGVCSVDLRNSLHGRRQAAHIGVAAVAETALRQGIASQLINLAELAASQRGIPVIEAFAMNDASRKMLASLDYEIDNSAMARKLLI